MAETVGSKRDQPKLQTVSLIPAHLIHGPMKRFRISKGRRSHRLKSNPSKGKLLRGPLLVPPPRPPHRDPPPPYLTPPATPRPISNLRSQAAWLLTQRSSHPLRIRWARSHSARHRLELTNTRWVMAAEDSAGHSAAVILSWCQCHPDTQNWAINRQQCYNFLMLFTP